MTQLNDLDAPDAIDALDAQDTLVAAPPSTNLLRLRFTGSGSEYFRIWIVNLLLTIVTLTLYLPWARARKLRYFMGNTLVDNQPLGFHGKPVKMFKGYLLVCVFFGLYSVAGEISPVAGMVALVAGVLLWPALFKSSLQFRLANTSWRGLRFSFRGSLGGAYRAMLPVLIPAAILVSGQYFAQDPSQVGKALIIVVGLVMLTSMVISPWLLWNLKQYQHNNYALGNLQTTFKAGPGSFYLLTLKTLGVVLLIIAVNAGLFGALFGFGFASRSGRPSWDAAMLAGFIGIGVSWAVAALCLRPYVTSRMQNLVWTQTGNVQLRFVSDLHFRSLFWLTLKNLLLVVITLGLYWPFAVVATTRLRLEAVTVKTRIDPALLVADAQASSVEAVGDAAGDFFGLDVGL